jgi:phosphotransferase system enzyme I (PtsI)
MLRGIPASPGISIGKAFIYENNKVEITKEKVEDIAAEKERFHSAVNLAKKQIVKIREDAEEKIGSERAAIFDAHVLMLEDPEFAVSVETQIEKEGINAEYAVKSTVDNFVSIFETMENEYFRERAADVKDVGARVLDILAGVQSISLSEIDEECIVVARDLTPSDTAQMNKSRVVGFITDVGGKTSHSAIMAAALGIPAVTGLKNATGMIKPSEVLVVDGYEGIVLVNPDKGVLKEYEDRIKKIQIEKEGLTKLKDKEAKTVDGIRIEIAGNIGTATEAENVANSGGEGIGLFRTEFLFMDRDSMPSENEQFEAYREVLEKMGNKPVIIRTLDIGGDKKLSYLDIGSEMNPFLGYRAIRLCLDRKDIFRTQLRALLRASVYGNLKIMFPMISSLQELKKALTIVDEVKEELKREGIEYKDIDIGIMIEVPSAAVISDILAKQVDFFSIGTNDLIQYSLAVDRMNERISQLYDPYHPAVLRLIKLVIENAHREGKKVGMCGEMAGDFDIIPLLIGMGIDELSMSPAHILRAKKIVRESEYDILREMADEALKLGSSEEIKELIKLYKNKHEIGYGG